MSAERRHLVDIGEVAQMLNARAEALCRELLPDGRRRGAEWESRSAGTTRYGNFNVHVTGSKAGVWKDFVAGVGGDALDLVAYMLFGGDKARAFAWARRWLGVDSADPKALEQARRSVPSPAARQAEAAHEQENKRNAAARIFFGGSRKGLLGTPVELYLRGRGIPIAELPREPRSIRFHPTLWHKDSNRAWPAMLTCVAGPDNQFAGVHRTWLEVCSDGSVRKAPIERNKMVLGSYAGGSVHLWRGASGKPLMHAPDGEIADITEGIEDGLSVAIAVPECRVLAAISLSNLAAVTLPPTIRTVRLWRQNDHHPQAIEAFRRAYAAHAAAGRQVLVPPIPPEVKDVNDLLRTG